MSSAVAVSVVPVIVQLIADSPQQSASGTRIAATLRASYPEFSPLAEGCRSFRQFIRDFVPQVAESPQRAGMDVIYVLKSPTTVEAKPEALSLEPTSKTSGFVSLLLNNPRAWKTFASPFSTSKIYVHPHGGEVRVSPAHAGSPGGTWLRIDPISAASLLQIAKDFIELVPELYRPALAESLSQPKWWIPYFDVMGSLGLKSRWVAFRRRRILDEFMSAVAVAASAGRQQVPVQASGLVSADDLLGRTEPPKGPVVEGLVESGGEDRLRVIALFAVRNMTLAELRGLAIPLGYIADALKENR